MNVGVFSELLLNMYRSAQELPVTVFPDVGISMIKKMIDFDMALFGLFSIDQDDKPLGHFAHLHNEQLKDIEEWIEISKSDFVLKNMVKNPGTAMSYVSHISLSNREHASLLDYAMRRKHSNLLTLANNYGKNGIYSGLSLRRSDRRWQFENKDNKIIEIIMPHFNEALRINRSLFAQRISNSTTEVFRGCCIFDDSGLIHYQDHSYEAFARSTFQDFEPYKLPNDLRVGFCHNRHHRIIRGHFIFEAKKIGHLHFVHIRTKRTMDVLTEREFEIAMFYGTGLSSKEIAVELFISPSTVRRHLESIYFKLKIKSKADLAFLVHANQPGTNIETLFNSFLE